MYLKGWFSTWLKNNSLPNSSLDHISRYNQNNNECQNDRKRDQFKIHDQKKT